MPARGPRSGYGPAFYPGTPDPASAIEITVGRGEERRGVDFSLVRQSSARLAGRVVGIDGQPAANVGLFLRTGSTTSGSKSANGLFSWEALSPGRYTILARTAGSTMWAMREVHLNGEDVTGVTLALEPGLTFSGRVSFDAMKVAPPKDVTSVRLTLRGPSVLSTPIPVNPDGTFSVSTVIPGRYQLDATIVEDQAQSTTAQVWSIKSAVVDGNDVGDAEFLIEPGRSVSDVVVTFTDRTGELVGTLVDAADRPAGGYYVVVFPADRSYWARSGRWRPPPARTATDGTFRFSGLPAGNYHIVALTEIDQQDLGPLLFSRLAPMAMTIALQDGGRKEQTLKLTGN
jgi:hypothetical protein